MPVLSLEMCAQHVYFSHRMPVICWADNEKNNPESSYGCDNKAETEIMLCAYHYTQIFGHDPEE